MLIESDQKTLYGPTTSGDSDQFTETDWVRGVAVVEGEVAEAGVAAGEQ